MRHIWGAHPGQTVKSIAVLMKPMTLDTIWIAHADLTITLRGKKTKYGGPGGDCTANAAGLDCAMDCDAGGFTLARGGAGVKLVNTSDIDLGSGESPGPFVRANNSEDRTFLLLPAAAAACK